MVGIAIDASANDDPQAINRFPPSNATRDAAE
jgi:hypothetical protein